mgnify:CR=1 FL=1
MNIFWFRRDLRIDDNVGFFHALNSNEEVLPIFIFDEDILSQLPKNDARVSFIHEQLEKIQLELNKIGKSLAVFHGKPIEIFEKLIAENKITSVFTNHDYEPYARKRDKEMNQLFVSNGISFLTSKDQVIFEKSEVVKDDGTPYVVYTPYSKKWKEKLQKTKLTQYKSEDKLEQIVKHKYPFLSLEDIGCFDDIPETANTIEGNAILKANYVTGKFGYACFADDTGLEVAALNGEPGVFSARYAGEQKDSNDNMDKLLANLKGNTNRKAHFKTVICLNLNGKQQLFTGIINGQITTAKKGNNGFGYDPIFIPKGYKKTFGEMKADFKDKISHRYKAFSKIKKYFKY